MANAFVQLACAFARATVASTFVPCLKVTVPVGTPPYCPVTTAVKVTDCPTYDGLRFELKATVLVA